VSGDIVVSQIRKIASLGRMDDADVQVVFDAADEIERLRAAGDALAEALRVDGVTFGCSCLWDADGTPECVSVGRPHPPRRPSRTAAALAVWEARREQ
jgi:hypothetical protein